MTYRNRALGDDSIARRIRRADIPRELLSKASDYTAHASQGNAHEQSWKYSWPGPATKETQERAQRSCRLTVELSGAHADV
jgi:hypothetical protein